MTRNIIKEVTTYANQTSKVSGSLYIIILKKKYTAVERNIKIYKTVVS